MKTFFTKKVQKKILSKIKIKRKPEFVSLSYAESLLFIFDMREEGIFKAVLEFITSVKNLGIKVRGIALGSKSNQEIIPEELREESIQLIGKNDTDYIGLPVCKIPFIDSAEPLDILVDFSNSYNFTGEFLVRSANVALRVGRSGNRDNPYDIVVGSRNIDPIQYQELVVRYLSLINAAR